jgi:hypothetical protein
MSVSKPYGGYGGVGRNKYIPPAASEFSAQPSLTPPKTRYVPPSVPDYIPHPASIPFTYPYRDKLENLAGEQSPILNINNVLIRTQTDSLTGDIDKNFDITALGNTDYKLTYTMPASATKIDMLKTDGGFF